MRNEDMKSYRTLILASLVGALIACSPPTDDSAATPSSRFDGVAPAPAESPPGTWHGEREGVEFFSSGENLAFDEPAPTVHPRLTEHSQKMVPGVYQVPRVSTWPTATR